MILNRLELSMEVDFWLKKWERNEIGFHEKAVNPLLAAHFSALELAPGSRIFLPLCGKSLDIAWLLAQGHRVVGVELSRLAIEQLFQELGVMPTVHEAGSLSHFAAQHLDIFVGDFFELDRQHLGPVDAIYDRAALIALPPPMREDYCAHLREISGSAPQLLVTLDYDQACMAGPPFSVPEAELRQHYARHYALQQLASAEIAGGLKGQCPGQENVWLLRPGSGPR